MNLYVLRHGIAEEPGTPGRAKDAERELTPNGKRKLRQIAKGMTQAGVSLDVILSSPYLRARQTAEIVAGRYVGVRFELCDALAPSGSMKKLIELIEGLEGANDDVLLVGHEPYLSEFISLVISGQISVGIQMKKGGLCKVAVEHLRHARCGVLEWLLVPKHLRKLS